MFGTFRAHQARAHTDVRRSPRRRGVTEKGKPSDIKLSFILGMLLFCSSFYFWHVVDTPDRSDSSDDGGPLVSELYNFCYRKCIKKEAGTRPGKRVSAKRAVDVNILLL